MSGYARPGGSSLPLLQQRHLEEWANNGIIYYQDPDNPVINDYRRVDSGAFLYDERYNGTTWDIITIIGGSIIVDKAVVNDLSGGLFFDNPITNDRINLIKPSTSDNGISVGDTRNSLFLLADTLEDLKIGYNGDDCENTIEGTFTETLNAGEYTTQFTCTDPLDATLLFATLKVSIATKISISIIDNLNNRVAYLTMSEAEFIETGGIAIEDKDTGLKTGEITINLFSIGTLISGRTYDIVIKVSEGSLFGSATFPFFGLSGKKQKTSIVAGRDWVTAEIEDHGTDALIYKGGYDVATNTPNLTISPTGVLVGYFYEISVRGDFFGKTMEVGDVLIAEVDDPTQLGDWTALNRVIDAVSIKALYESNANTNAFTDAEQTKLYNLSGTNTGDQDLSPFATITQINNTTGYANYLDSATLSVPRDYDKDTEAPLVNDKTFPDGSRYPNGVTSYWDSVNSKFIPDQDNANYAFSVNFHANPTDRDKRLIVKFIAYGAGAGGSDVIVQERLVRLQKDAGEITPVSLSFTTGITPAIKLSGVSVTLEFQDTDSEVYDITCGLTKVGGAII